MKALSGSNSGLAFQTLTTITNRADQAGPPQEFTLVYNHLCLVVSAKDLAKHVARTSHLIARHVDLKPRRPLLNSTAGHANNLFTYLDMMRDDLLCPAGLRE